MSCVARMYWTCMWSQCFVQKIVVCSRLLYTTYASENHDFGENFGGKSIFSASGCSRPWILLVRVAWTRQVTLFFIEFWNFEFRVTVGSKKISVLNLIICTHRQKPFRPADTNPQIYRRKHPYHRPTCPFLDSVRIKDSNTGHLLYSRFGKKAKNTISWSRRCFVSPVRQPKQGGGHFFL